jgi:hypothetical protein
MRNWRIVFVSVALIGVLALLAPPASAGEASFTDPEGDATGVSSVPSTPRPSDKELDILQVSFSSSAEALTAVVRYAAIGAPPAATGSTRTVTFSYEGADYSFRFQSPQPPADNVSATGFFFRKGGTTIPCSRCSGKFDAKKNSLVLTAEFKSMHAGMKSEDPKVPAIGPGKKISGLRADTFRTIGISALTSDTATPAKPVEMTL